MSISPLLSQSVPPYVWAIGTGVADIPEGTTVNGRYQVIAPQTWLDTQPARSPNLPSELPDAAVPYLQLYPHRLHIPEVYGVCELGPGHIPVLLLHQIPVDSAGNLLPAIDAALEKVPAVRQVYWLWQMLQLWTPLKKLGVASSLLVASNLRVEGWRLRLRELYLDEDADANFVEGAPAFPALQDLAQLWLAWSERLQPEVFQPVRDLCQQMQFLPRESAVSAEAHADSKEVGRVPEAIAARLNQLLLEQSAHLPLHLTVMGKTTTGPQRAHNEDACYPNSGNDSSPVLLDSTTKLRLAIICDGIGGHAGGEVASQLAVRSLQLQIRALLAEVAEQEELATPEEISQQIEAVIRVVNNLIAAQNDEQGRESRQRMGTTLMLALQVPQKVKTSMGEGNAHELYLAHVGDSRAYWITPRYCHLLTVDDDVATREVRMARSLYLEAMRRADATALTQALGTRDAEFIRPNIQRFIVDEDGLLLLCSDGVSDNNFVEKTWEQTTQQFFKDKQSLEGLIQAWLELANQQNGHDNASMVIMNCRVSPERPRLFEPSLPLTSPAAAELSEASKALLYGEAEDEAETQPEQPTRPTREPQPASLGAIALGVAVITFAVGAAGILIWQGFDPAGFERTWQRLLQPQVEQEAPVE